MALKVLLYLFVDKFVKEYAKFQDSGVKKVIQIRTYDT